MPEKIKLEPVPFMKELAKHFESKNLTGAANYLERAVGTNEENPDQADGIAGAITEFAETHELELPEDFMTMKFKTKIEGDIVSVTPYFGEGIGGGIATAIFVLMLSTGVFSLSD